VQRAVLESEIGDIERNDFGTAEPAGEPQQNDRFIPDRSRRFRERAALAPLPGARRTYE
jgi:hypothetical protein